ncbi:MAG: extracellular solute-binding protein [Candidatus Eremiobacteraeota bacterium]|nr:extracellular solute-binding protein [Candidatus Eremiobacteraeota bacterium]
MLILVLLVAGCAQPDPKDRPLRVWTAFEGPELAAFQGLCEKYGKPVKVLGVPFEGLKNKVLVATPAGQGPDVIVGPQDWLGVFSAADLLEPLPESLVAPLKKEVLPVALDGVTYEGKVYAYPILLDGLALLRNPELAPRAPKSIEDLRDYAVELQKDGKIKGFYYDLRELYFSWPFFSACGASVFRPGGLEPGLTGPEGVQATQYLKSLRDQKLIPLGAQNDFAKSMFLDGKLAMTLNGPWFLGDIRKRKTPYVIEPVPPGSHPAASFIGVNGLMVNGLSPRKQDAFPLIEFLGNKDCQVTMSLASGRPPARLDAQAEVAKDPVTGPDIAAFTRVVQQGVAMPNHPAANAVWDPMKQSVELITKGEVLDPAGELHNADEAIRQKIQRMVD